MVHICRSRESVAYYLSEKPTDGKCPVCSKKMARFVENNIIYSQRLTVAAFVNKNSQNIFYNVGESH